MKSLNNLFNGTLILSASLFLFSCTKHITEPQEEKVTATMQSPVTSCKPTVFGVLVTFPNNNTIWKTLMQKWYDGNGRLSNIKANISLYHEIWGGDQLTLPWGVVTYHGNQVYVHDNGKMLLRVTLDDQKRPLASYYYSDAKEPGQYNEIDTSYYYYTGDRLTQVFSLRYFGNPMALMYNFIYDAHGNLVRVQTGNSPNSYKAHFTYNYNKPSNGMLAYFNISTPLKLMEYMDLVHFPMHHELTQFLSGAFAPGSPYPYETFPVYVWDYMNHSYNGNNQVQSYEVRGPSARGTLYTGWDCGSAPAADAVNRARTGHISSLEDFKQRFPN